jgi:hypothetical protein
MYASGEALRTAGRPSRRIRLAGAIAVLLVVGTILLMAAVWPTRQSTDPLGRHAPSVRGGPAVVREVPVSGPHGPRQTPKVGRSGLEH